MRRYIFVLLLLTSCSNLPEGFEDAGNDVGKQLLGFGDGHTKVGQSTFSQIVITASRNGVVEDYWTMSEVFPLDQPFQKGSFEDIYLGQLVENDSVRWVVPYGVFRNSIFNEYEVDHYTLSDTSRIFILSSIRQVMDEQTYFKSREKAIRERRMEEQQHILSEFKRRGIAADMKEYLGTWQRDLEVGKGEAVTAGMDLILGFHGYFLNDSLFDSATDSASWIYFQYGKPDQVIRGLEIGVSSMNIGGKKELWLTSDLAFGERGSGKGIVPPNTPVRFEIELLDPEKVLRQKSNIP